MNRLLTATVAVVALGAPASAAQPEPRVIGELLLGFCSGDPDYRPAAYPGCLHYANGVLDARTPDCELRWCPDGLPGRLSRRPSTPSSS